MSKRFDPNAASSSSSGIFGLPYDTQESSVIYLPVPWEVTTSYGRGTADGPDAILEASRQIDLLDSLVEKPYEAGLSWTPEPSKIRGWNEVGSLKAQAIIDVGGDLAGDSRLENTLREVNALGDELNQTVFEHSLKWLNEKKCLGIVGGDHSIPFGAYQAIAEQYPSFGILHFDAHSDTRIVFEGFQWSHASIMYNALENIPQISKLVQVGIRDYCEQEADYVREQSQRVQMFTDRAMHTKLFEGASFKFLVDEMLAPLPKDVWVSFDIDALEPAFCPHTGTPVPGGLNFNEAVYTIECLARSGRRIIGMDLVEVAPGKDSEWDANVGARLLYRMTALMLVSQGKRPWKK